MGSASTAIRHTDGCSGFLDGSAAREFSCDDELAAAFCAGFGRTGQAVPRVSPALESSSRQEEPQGSQEEVVLCQLWFRLSFEDRARFGGCFSQMVFRVLQRQARREEGVGAGQELSHFAGQNSASGVSRWWLSEARVK